MIGAILAISIGTVITVQATDNSSRLISVYDQGVEHRFLTKEKTIGTALREAGIALDERDHVEPALTEKLVASDYQVNIYRVRPVLVIDGNIRLKVLSARQTADQIAKDAGITLHDADKTDLALSTNVIADGAGQVMTITRATPLTLDLYGKKTQLHTQARTVKELLREKNITLGDDDRLSLPEETPITASIELRIWREGIQTISVEEEIPPASRIVYDMDQPLGYRAAQSAGVTGIKTVAYQIEIRHGNELSRVKLHEVITREPQDKVEVIGLKNTGRGLSVNKGAQIFTDSKGVAHRETYYDLPMNVVMRACGQGGSYTVRPDGVKVDRDGYIIIAAHLGNYPRCSIVETSLGPGKVYDTGGFAERHPHGFDIATDWTKADGI